MFFSKGSGGQLFQHSIITDKEIICNTICLQGWLIWSNLIHLQVLWTENWVHLQVVSAVKVLTCCCVSQGWRWFLRIQVAQKGNCSSTWSSLTLEPVGSLWVSLASVHMWQSPQQPEPGSRKSKLPPQSPFPKSPCQNYTHCSSKSRSHFQDPQLLSATKIQWKPIHINFPYLMT